MVKRKSAKIKTQLVLELLRGKPIEEVSRENQITVANFKNLVENSDYRQQWFDFRQKQWEYFVWNTIQTNLGL